MNLRSNIFFFGLIALPLLHSHSANSAEVERLEWAPVPGATHYIGTVTGDGNTYKIRTTSTWILTERGTVKTIDAWQGNSSLRTGISVQKNEISAPSPTQSSADDERPESPTASESAPLEPTPVPDQEVKPETPDQEDTISSDTDSVPVELETTSTESESTVTAETPPEDHSTFSYYSKIGVGIGMGRQWISSVAGISEFNGGSNIGGTILSGSFASTQSPFWYEGEFSAHNFSTETSRSGASTESKTEEKNTQMRLRVSVFYNFIQQVSPLPVGPSVGGGLQYLKHPLLAIDNKQTGSATMKTESGVALNLGVRYGKLLSLRNHLATGVDMTPLSFSKDVKTLSTNAFVAWQHLVTPRVYTNLGVVTGREKITATGTCPAVTNCREEGSTKSDLLQFRMGLSVGF